MNEKRLTAELRGQISRMLEHQHDKHLLRWSTAQVLFDEVKALEAEVTTLSRRLQLAEEGRFQFAEGWELPRLYFDKGADSDKKWQIYHYTNLVAYGGFEDMHNEILRRTMEHLKLYRAMRPEAVEATTDDQPKSPRQGRKAKPCS